MSTSQEILEKTASLGKTYPLKLFKNIFKKLLTNLNILSIIQKSSEITKHMKKETMMIQKKTKRSFFKVKSIKNECLNKEKTKY